MFLYRFSCSKVELINLVLYLSLRNNKIPDLHNDAVFEVWPSRIDWLGGNWRGFERSRMLWMVPVWPDGYIIFQHLEQWKFAQKYKIFAKVGSQFCQILKKWQMFFPKWRNFAKSGHTGWGSQQLTGDEVSYLPISQTNLVISLRALSPLF